MQHPNLRWLFASVLLLASVGAVDSSSRMLTITERVQALEELDRVRLMHRIGTRESSSVGDRAALEIRVRDELERVERVRRAIGAADLERLVRRERERIERSTHLPERLRELYRALGNDNQRIAELLVMPGLVRRLERHLDLGQTLSSLLGSPPSTPLAIADVGCALDDGWSPTSLQDAPESRTGATAVWTGNLVLVWGGGADLGTGGRYDPVLDAWSPISTTGAPAGRREHAAIWTGAEMIVWGGRTGGTYLDDGGRYDPTSDTWSPVSLLDAPAHRSQHSAVWTGEEMIVWGGLNEDSGPFESWCGGLLCCGDYLSSGGRYDPLTDTWTATSTMGAPHGAAEHVAVWSGEEMIVWSGRYFDRHPVSCFSALTWTYTGGRYDPATDGWNTFVSPAWGRPGATGVWDGDEMIVWGGPSDEGVRFDPQSDQWSTISPDGAPAGREGATAVWTGDRLLAWGGRPALFGGDPFDTGGRYAPDLDSWTSTTTSGAPSARWGHLAVWTDAGMFVWGATTDGTGGIYDPGSPDADNDGMPEICDPCVNDPINDPDGDTVCAAVDNCSATSNPDQNDKDLDLVGDACDNCPDTANFDQADGDADGAGDVCDCLPADPAARRPPIEATGLRWSSVTNIEWDSMAAEYGSGTTYDLMRGDLAELPVGQGAGELCAEDELTSSATEIFNVPPVGAAFYLLLRPANACGVGIYGTDSNGVERMSAACP